MPKYKVGDIICANHDSSVMAIVNKVTDAEYEYELLVDVYNYANKGFTEADPHASIEKNTRKLTKLDKALK